MEKMSRYKRKIIKQSQEKQEYQNRIIELNTDIQKLKDLQDSERHMLKALTKTYEDKLIENKRKMTELAQENQFLLD